MELLDKVLKLVKGGDARSKEAKKNIIYSFTLKGGSIIISLMLVPLTLKYLDATEFGIWLTLSSLLVWINYFDIGLGNGLRNKLTQALAVGNFKIGQIYVSTTFALLGLIMGIFFFLFFVINPFLDWGKILNTDPLLATKLSKIVVAIFGFFCLQFIFKTVGIIYVAHQRPALSDLINVLGNLLSLCVIFILTLTTSRSLNYVAITFSCSPVIIMLIAYLITFRGKYKYLKPKLSLVQFKYTKELMGLGVQFFIIQIAVSLVIYTSTNIIIAQLFGTEKVTIYNIAYKYFYTVSMTYIIIIMPFWSAATDAYTKKDYKWIKFSIKKLIYIFIGFVFLTIIMVLFANMFYLFWVGKSVKIPITLSICVAIYVTLFNWSNTFIYFINGIGKIRLQLYTTVIIAIIYIPSAIYLGKIYGVNGVVIASCISILPTSILMPIQCVKLYTENAKGIWNK
jgi:O-antigen/teichoic acid export membrane protein